MVDRSDENSITRLFRRKDTSGGIPRLSPGTTQWQLSDGVTLVMRPHCAEFLLPPLRRHIVDTLSTLRNRTQFQHAQPLPGGSVWLSLLLGWLLTGGLLLPVFFSPPRHWKVVGWTCAWGASGALLVYAGLETLFAKEYLRLVDGQLHIGMKSLWGPRVSPYKLPRIHNLRLSPDDGDYEGRLCFEYGDRTCDFGYNLSRHDAEILLTSLSQCLKIPYYAITRVVFGNEPGNDTHQPKGDAFKSCLKNPNVAQLRYPLRYLKEIHVYADTASHHQIEQFLTYGLASLGQQYFAAHVTVCIYGDVHKLSVNVRNSLTNVCKSVIVLP